MVKGMGREGKVGKKCTGRIGYRQGGNEIGREGEGWEKEGQEGKGKIERVRGRFRDRQKQGLWNSKHFL